MPGDYLCDGETEMFLHAGYRRVAPDLWGHGRTDPASDGARSPARQAALVQALVEHLGLGPVHVVGHSYGGATGLRLLLDRPAAVQSIVLIEPTLQPLLRDAGETALDDTLNALIDRVTERVEAGDRDGAWRTFVDANEAPGAWDRLDAATQARMLKLTDTVVAGYGANRGNDVTRAALAGIGVPTTVVHGANTSDAYRTVCGLVARHVPGAWAVTIDGAKHMSPVTHPADVGAVIAAHLASVASAWPPAAA